MTRIRLRYVKEYTDRHGKARRYFRRPGFKPVALTGTPGSEEFMAAYQAASDGRVEIGAGRVAPGTVFGARRLVLRICGLSDARADHEVHLSQRNREIS